MKVLLDENLPHDLRKLLPGHDVFTVAYLGWAGVKNGELLRRAAADGFDVMITNDNGVPYQQNLQTLAVALIVLSSPSNDIDDLRPLVPDILRRLQSLVPRTVVRVP
jgi:hypothetical protein